MERRSHRYFPALIAAGAFAATIFPAFPQSPAGYPVKPVRVIVMSAPGGGVDVVGRLVADRLARSRGWALIVDNRPGASGNIATEMVAKAAKDGYTLLLTTNSHNINAFIYRRPGYDVQRDFASVAQLTEAPSVLLANVRTAFRSLKDVENAARAQPGKIVYGSGGNGSPTHIAAEMFKTAANIDLTHIPYKGGGLANQDLLGGQIPLAMAALPAVMPQVQAGLFRALGVTSLKRWRGLTDVSTFAESGYPGFSHMTWIGIFAPAGTPQPIVARLNQGIAAALADAELRERIIAIGAEPVGRSPADFDAVLRSEYDATGKLVARLGLKVD